MTPLPRLYSTIFFQQHTITPLPARHTQAPVTIFYVLPKQSSMRMKFSCLAVIILAMWLGGFGCALCCATGVTESCCLDERNSAACGVKSCCAKAESKGAPASEDAISPLPGVIGCSLLPDQTRSLAPLTRVSTDLPDGVQAIDSSIANIDHARIPPFIDPPSPLNRGGTYLRCCVLLI